MKRRRRTSGGGASDASSWLVEGELEAVAAFVARVRRGPFRREDHDLLRAVVSVLRGARVEPDTIARALFLHARVRRVHVALRGGDDRALYELSEATVLDRDGWVPLSVEHYEDATGHEPDAATRAAIDRDVAYVTARWALHADTGPARIAAYLELRSGGADHEEAKARGPKLAARIARHLKSDGGADEVTPEKVAAWERAQARKAARRRTAKAKRRGLW